MKFSPSIEILWRLAANEMATGQFPEIAPEHFCLALLKFAEVSVKAPATLGEEAELAKVVSDEAQQVREALQKRGIDSTGARRKLRAQLGKGETPFAGGEVHRSAASRALFEGAAALARRSGATALTPLHLLAVLMQSPTPPIASVVLDPSAAAGPNASSALLERHGRDLLKLAAAGGQRVKPGVEAPAKAVLDALAQKDRRSVLLLSDQEELAGAVVNALAAAMAGGKGPDGLAGRRLIDIAGGSDAGAAGETACAGGGERDELERVRSLLAEAAAHPEVVLVLPAVTAEPEAVQGGAWTRLVRQTLSKGAVQFIARVTPSLHTDGLRKDPVWRRRPRAIWLEETPSDGVPSEL